MEYSTMARQRSNKRPRVFRGPASDYAGADTEIMEVSFPAVSSDTGPAKLGRAHEYAGCLIGFRRTHDGTPLIDVYAADDAIRVSAPPECTPVIESIAVVLESRPRRCPVRETGDPMSLRTTAKPNAPGDRVALVVHRCTAVASWRADRATVIEINGQGVCLVSFDAFPDRPLWIDGAFLSSADGVTR